MKTLVRHLVSCNEVNFLFYFYPPLVSGIEKDYKAGLLTKDNWQIDNIPALQIIWILLDPYDVFFIKTIKSIREMGTPMILGYLDIYKMRKIP